MNPTTVAWLSCVIGFTVVGAGLCAFIRWFIVPMVDKLQDIREDLQDHTERLARPHS